MAARITIKKVNDELSRLGVPGPAVEGERVFLLLDRRCNRLDRPHSAGAEDHRAHAGAVDRGVRPVEEGEPGDHAPGRNQGTEQGTVKLVHAGRLSTAKLRRRPQSGERVAPQAPRPMVPGRGCASARVTTTGSQPCYSYSVAPLCVLAVRVACAEGAIPFATAFLLARFRGALARALCPASFAGTAFAARFGAAGAVAACLAFLIAAHLFFCAATIWARPATLKMRFFVARATATVEGADAATCRRWRRSAIRDSICFSISW